MLLEIILGLTLVDLCPADDLNVLTCIAFPGTECFITATASPTKSFCCHALGADSPPSYLFCEQVRGYHYVWKWHPCYTGAIGCADEPYGHYCY